MKNIKDFVNEVTDISMIRNYWSVNTIVEIYNKHIQEFEAACKDLYFSTILSEEKREQANKQILEDANMLGNVMNELNDDTKNIVEKISTNLTLINGFVIEYSELKDPDRGFVNIRGSNNTASYGNLKEFYTKFDILWTTKLQIYLVAFILCIAPEYFITTSVITEAKISNFERAHIMYRDKPMPSLYRDECIPWLEPEVIHEKLYYRQIEIFR
ncbi:7129_t:CDS:2 [Diversispora eburnea]|uniref:7129_t:CDS:1 n=1 Tax=Diversispora eburnea TaxID=1213867 RepID=A0A9N9BRM3_9GLOM|nr:7129_t:CDS:2 [Diversispora eburnea]